jgi:hypothetical protein
MANKKFVFMFNEAERDRYERLGEVITDYMAAHQPWPQNVLVRIGNDSFENTAEGILSGLEEQKRNLAPTFAFVDPFGVKGLPMVSGSKTRLRALTCSFMLRVRTR